jgi:hypothetical protein
VLAMIEEKTKGREITILPSAPARGGVIDLMEALKESMRTVQRKNPAEQKKRKRRELIPPPDRVTGSYRPSLPARNAIAVSWLSWTGIS